MEEIFVGRKEELELLESFIGKPSAFLIYGRRRVGKTTLLRQFCKGKRSLYLCASRLGEKENLEYFAEELASATDLDVPVFSSYRDFFRTLKIFCESSPSIIVFDEYQYLSDRTPAISSYLQHFIDTYLKETDSMVILCGSSISSIRSEGTDTSKPLYGRFNRIIELKPLTFEECRELHPEMPDTDALKLYLTVGGIPRYHLYAAKSYKDYILDNCLGNGWLTEEAMYLLTSEFPNAEKYESILSAIASGSVSLKEISVKTGTAEPACIPYLNRLADTGIIATMNPMLGAPKRKRYLICDGLFQFYYEIAVRRRLLLEGKDKEAAFEAVSHYIDSFLGKRFELFCAEYLKNNYPVAEQGKWWIDRPDFHAEIDIISRISNGRNVIDLFTECKYIKEPAGFHEYNQLDKASSFFEKNTNPRLMLMSVSGFDKELTEAAAGLNLILIGPDELFGLNPAPEIS